MDATMVQGVLDLAAPSPTVPAQGLLPAGLEALRSRLGLLSSSDMDRVEDAVLVVLTELGYEARVVSTRHGTLRLTACPQTAVFLRYDADAVLAGVNRRAPGAIERVVVEVERAGRVTPTR